jgi:probable non-F420 flavinoid oxidoreductase
LPGREPGKEGSVITVGFHASQEQLAPSAALAAVRDAEEAGFGAAMSSDHFSPWSERQGESGFAWSWLGAAMQATSLPFGVVNAPGQRYHPAVVAQAIATLAELFPGRFWAALGTGEASNEHITGDPWPAKHRRNQRLAECVEVIRGLLAGEEVSHDGLVRVDRARLWSLPPQSPPLLAAAVTPATARWAAAWADGIITVNQPVESLRRVLDAFDEGGGEGRRRCVQAHLAWAPDEEEALSMAHDQWRTNLYRGDVNWDVATVAEFDELARFVRPEDVRGPVLVSADLSRHLAWLQEIADLGVDEIYLHHVGKEQERFLEAFATRVLPELGGRS